MDDPGRGCGWGGLPLVTRLDALAPRARVRVEATVTAAGMGRLGGTRAYWCVLDDGSGCVAVAFTGRDHVPGLVVGARCRIDGTVRDVEGRLTVCNPGYELLPYENGQR